MDVLCYSRFLLYIPLFLSRLLKVQHCTHLPFGNDSDLLRKKNFFFEKSHGLVALPSRPMWQMLLANMVE